jgi:hypothetical protein
VEMRASLVPNAAQELDSTAPRYLRQAEAKSCLANTAPTNIPPNGSNIRMIPFVTTSFIIESCILRSPSML